MGLMTDDVPSFTLLRSVAPWLSVTDGSAALTFYKRAFGVRVLRRLEDRSGRVGFAQLRVGATEFWLQENSDARPDPCHAQIHMTLTADDPDSLISQAIAAGATELEPISDARGWRCGRLADPFGHLWEVGERPATPRP